MPPYIALGNVRVYMSVVEGELCLRVVDPGTKLYARDEYDLGGQTDGYIKSTDITIGVKATRV